MTSVRQRFGIRRFTLWAVASCAVGLGLMLTSCTSIASLTGSASSPYAEQLANHLTAQNAVMYGAYWCPHCADQKALFGRAVAAMPYVECDPGGKNPQPQLCQDKGIQGYPTWEINGEFYLGPHSLKELAELSDFAAPQ